MIQGPFICWNPTQDETEEDGFVIKQEHFSLYEVAEAAAEYDFSNCDGWERRDDIVTWRIKCPDGTIADVDVERRMEPVFNASDLKVIK